MSDLLAILGLAATQTIVAVPQALPAAFLPYRATLQREVQFRWGLPAPLALVAAQLQQESGFDPDARSYAGAIGIGQFMPSTSVWVAQQLGGAPAPLNPTWSIRATVYYDRWLIERVSYPNECHAFGAALSAYNGGLGWHNKRQDRAKVPHDFWGSVRTINPGITAANQRENESYSARIVYQRQAEFRALGGRLVCIT